MPTVAIVKGEGKELSEMIDDGLNMLGGIDSYVKRDDKVLIKPNLSAIKTWETGATTDPRLAEEIINRLKKVTDNILLGESDHSAITAEYAFDKLGYAELAKRYGVTLVNLSDKSRLVDLNNENCFFLTKMGLHEDILSADLIINLPVMKTNEISLVSLALKNNFGLLPERNKAKFHANIHEVIADINRFIKKTFVVLDARVAMEGNGPVDGDVVKLDLLLCGDDSVALDCVAARIMGFDSDEIKHISMSEFAGVGSTKNVQIKGEKLDAVVHRFKRAGKISNVMKLKYFFWGHRFFMPIIIFISKIRDYLRI